MINPILLSLAAAPINQVNLFHNTVKPASHATTPEALQDNARQCTVARKGEATLTFTIFLWFLVSTLKLRLPSVVIRILIK